MQQGFFFFCFCFVFCLGVCVGGGGVWGVCVFCFVFGCLFCMCLFVSDTHPFFGLELHVAGNIKQTYFHLGYKHT